MQSAPIIITTLCRYEHLKKCISSLEKNRLSKETEVYIGLDYPLKESHREGYLKIKDYLENSEFGFKRVNIIKHNANRGWYENFISVREQVYKKYDTFIYVEDDNEFAIGYLEYMNVCLEKYRCDDSVYAIAGYRYPVQKEIETNGNVFRMNTYFSASGYGTWRNKEEIMYKELTYSNFEKMYQDRTFMKSLSKESRNQFCNFVRGMLEYKSYLIRNGEIEKIDLAFGLWMFHEKWNMIFPAKSLVRNCGYDGSGYNCDKIHFKKNNRITNRNYNYNQQHIWNAYSFGKIEEMDAIETSIMVQKINDFFLVSKIEFFKTIMAYKSCCLFGISKTKKFLSYLNKRIYNNL